MPKAGNLRKRLTFQAPANPEDRSKDSFGALDNVAGDEFLLWGSVEAIGGREYVQAAQAQALISHRVMIRFSARALTIDKEWKVAYEGHTLNVQVPPRDPDGRRRELELLCLEAQ